MEFVNRIFVMISIVCLVFSIPVKATDPFLSQDEIDEVFGPVSSKAEEAFRPISSSILEEAKEAIGPITPSTLDDAKEALGPISPSTIDETFDDAKEALGPSSSQVLDKAKEKFESWISQNKEDVPSSEGETKEGTQTPVSPSASSHLLDEAKQKFDSVILFITQNKHSSLLEEAEKEFGPIASIDIDNAQPPSTDDAESSKEEESNEDEAQKEIGPISSSDLEESVVSPSTSDEEEEVPQTKEEMSSSDKDAPSPSPSSFDDTKKAIGSISSKALDAAKEKFGSLFSQNKVAVETTTSSSVYFDHDVALAIESLIKQGKSKSELAIEEAKKQLNDKSVNIDIGKCVRNCMENYASCIRHLDKAMEDLRGRNSEFLTNDVSAVDGEISACQSCFSENQSPLKDLEEGIVTAARECLNVLDHSG